jgi:hypothetical protein
MKTIVAQASESAKPVISEVIRKDVMPWAVAGIIVMGAAAAAIGAAMARR